MNLLMMPYISNKNTLDFKVDIKYTYVSISFFIIGLNELYAYNITDLYLGNNNLYKFITQIIFLFISRHN